MRRTTSIRQVPEALVIDGKAIAARVRAEVKAAVERLAEAGVDGPGLATVVVGDDPASHVYVNGKRKASAEVGIRSIAHELPATTSADELLDLVGDLNRSHEVQGIVVQLPLPAQIEPSEVQRAIDPLKDVDGLTPTNAGLLAQGQEALVP